MFHPLHVRANCRAFGSIPSHRLIARADRRSVYPRTSLHRLSIAPSAVTLTKIGIAAVFERMPPL